MIIVRKETEPENDTIYSTEGDEKRANNSIAEQLGDLNIEGTAGQSEKDKKNKEILKLKKDVEDQLLKKLNNLEAGNEQELEIALDTIDTLKKSRLEKIKNGEQMRKWKINIHTDYIKNLNGNEKKKVYEKIEIANEEIISELQKKRGKPEKKEDSANKTDTKSEKISKVKETKTLEEKKKKETVSEVRSSEETEKERKEKANEEISRHFPEEVEEVNEEIRESGKDGDNKLEELDDRLMAARDKYVKLDLERDKKISVFRKVFRLNKDVDLGKFNDQYEEAKKEYKESLGKYKDYIKETTGDEAGADIMSDWLQRTEYLNLENVRVGKKIENKKWPEKIKNSYEGIVNSYRRLPRKKKLLIGIGMMGIGFATSAVGGVVATGGVLAIGAMRIFSVSASSIGFKQMFEARAEKGREKRARSKAESNVETSRLNNGKIDFESLNNILNKRIQNVDKEIEKRKLAARWRTIGAITSGVALSIAGHYIGREIMDHFRGEEAVSAAGEETATGSSPESMAGPSSEQSFLETESAPEQIEIVPQPVDVTAPVELTVEKGSSLEGTLIKYLNNHPEMIDKYSDLHGGVNFDSGQIAHRMALEFAENNADEFPGGPPSLIHPGAEININPENISITEVGDSEGLGYLSESGASPETESQGGIASENGDHVSIIGPESDSVVDSGADAEAIVSASAEVAPEINRNVITGSLYEKFHMFSGDYDKVSSIKMGSFMKLGSYHTLGAEYDVGEDYDYNEIRNLQKSIKDIYNNLSGTEKGLAGKMSVEKFIKANFDKLFSK